jgi:hypothetical protein
MLRNGHRGAIWQTALAAESRPYQLLIPAPVSGGIDGTTPLNAQNTSTEYREIPLYPGRVTRVSPEDYDRAHQHRWHATVGGFGGVYAARDVKRLDGTRKTERLHRYLMQAPPDKEVDHIDGDGLNNTRENLRMCDHAENKCLHAVLWQNACLALRKPVQSTQVAPAPTEVAA